MSQATKPNGSTIATFAIVSEIADELYERTQVFPTIRAVRDRMSGGSNTTIGKHLKQWKNEQLITTGGKNQDKHLTARLVTRMEDVYKELQEDAKYTFKVDKEVLENKLKEAEQKLIERNGEYLAITRKLAESEAKVEELNGEVEGYEDLVRSRQARISKLESDIATESKSVDQLKSREEKLESELATLRESLTATEEQVIARGAALFEYGESKNAEIKELLVKVGKLESDNKSINDKHDKALKEIDTITNVVNTYEKENGELENSLKNKEVTNQELSAALKRALKESKTNLSDFKNAEHSLNKLELELEATRSIVKDLEGSRAKEMKVLLAAVGKNKVSAK